MGLVAIRGLGGMGATCDGVPWSCYASAASGGLFYSADCISDLAKCGITASGAYSELPAPPVPAAVKPPPDALTMSQDGGDTTVGGAYNPTDVDTVIGQNKAAINSQNQQFFDNVANRNLVNCQANAQYENPMGYSVLGSKFYCSPDGTPTGFDISTYVKWGGIALAAYLLLSVVTTVGSSAASSYARAYAKR